MKYYLEFEEPIRLLDEEIHLKESILEKSSELTKEIALLHEDRLKLINKIHSNLTRWQRVQLARHPERPCLLYTSPSPRDVEESRMPSSA